MNQSVEASELGLKPGQWPREIVRQAKHFILQSIERDREGDVTYARYHESVLFGDTLEVWND